MIKNANKDIKSIFFLKIAYYDENQKWFKLHFKTYLGIINDKECKYKYKIDIFLKIAYYDENQKCFKLHFKTYLGIINDKKC